MRVLVLVTLGGLLALAVQPALIQAQASPVAATPPADAPCDGTPTTAHLLYATWPEGAPGGDLAVVNGRGEIERRLAAPPVVTGLATGWPDHALLWTADGQILLADAAGGTVVPLAIPAAATQQLAPVPVPGWNGARSRYWLLGGPLQPAAYLVDLATGEVTDLAAAITASGEAFTDLLAAFVAPDDGHILLWTSRNLYLLDPAAPASLTALDRGNGLAAPGFFRADGSLVYSRVNGTMSEVVIATLGPSVREERVIPLGRAPAPRRAVLLPLPDPAAAVLTWSVGEASSPRFTAYERLDLAAGRAEFLLSLPRAVGLPLIAPGGDRIVVGGEGPGGFTWQQVDLTTRARSPLPALDGLYSFATGLTSDYALFFPLAALQEREGVPGNRYVGLDLRTGATTELLQQRAGYTYSYPTFGPGQRVVLISVAGGDRAALLALDLATGERRTVTSEPVAGALLSPDGCWAVAVQDEALATNLGLLPIGGGAPIPLPAAAGAGTWVAP